MWYYLFASPAMTTFAFVKLRQTSFLCFHIVLHWTYVVSCLNLAICSRVECKCHLFICHIVNIQLLDAYKINFSTLNLKSWILHFWLPDGIHFYSTLHTTAILIYMCLFLLKNWIMMHDLKMPSLDLNCHLWMLNLN